MSQADTIHVPVPDAVALRPAGKTTWGIVTTIKAPLPAIARFVAYHLDLGAAEIHIFLDQPVPEANRFFASVPQVRITQCDEVYWSHLPEKAKIAHQLRQAFNATRTYRDSSLQWLAHIDVDEFILTQTPVSDLLATVPADCAALRLRPAELLAQPSPFTGPSTFKLPRAASDRSKGALARIYPNFGVFVPDGFLSHSAGKVMARTGLPDMRLGVHALKYKGKAISNETVAAGAHVGHAHAPTWQVFRDHLTFRKTKGAYRRKPNESMKLQDVLDLIEQDEGEDGLRRFYNEMCAATPELLASLRAHDMLLTATLDLDDKVARYFGKGPQ